MFLPIQRIDNKKMKGVEWWEAQRLGFNRERGIPLYHL